MSGPEAPVRYVDDVSYLANYFPELAPEWLNLVSTVCGFDSPDVAVPYRWCDLGCGPGLTPVILGATRPNGEFTGIDMMPAHVAEGQRLATQAGAARVTFHALDFQAAAQVDLGQFDFIVAHGVLAWIDDTAEEALLRFVDRHLAPGGLLYLGYNAYPGWAADAPLQHLISSLAAEERGDSARRAAAACARAAAFARVGAVALRGSAAADLDFDRRSPAYLAHEYLAPAWRPRFVNQVRLALRTIGLDPVGSASLVENFDSMVLRTAAREALTSVTEPNLRELARDFFLNQGFRRDVFGRSPAVLDEEERRRRLLATPFALRLPPERIGYAMSTQAGRVAFDNPVSRAIVAALVDGPLPLSECSGPEVADGDRIANALTLSCSGAIGPSVPKPQPVAHLNRALAGYAGKDEGTWLAMESGIVLHLASEFLALLGSSDTVGADAEAWRAFLASAPTAAP